MTNAITIIRLAGGAQGFNWLPVFLADEMGLFQKRGLQIEYKRMGSVDKATTAVLEGEADLAITPPEGAVTDFVKGGSLRIVAANAVRLPMSLVARPGINSPADLKGKKIGTSSLTEGTAIYTQIMLSDAGLHYPGDYEFELAGIHTKRWDALQTGQIDCAPQPAPWNFLAAELGYNLIGEVSEAIPEIIFTAIIGNEDWLQEHREAMDKFLSAMKEAHRITNNPANEVLALPIFQRITISDNEKLARRGFEYMRDLGMWPNGLDISGAALNTTIDMMIRSNLLDAGKREEARGVFDKNYLISALN